MTGTRSRWTLSRPPRPDDRVTLICFAHAGGGATAYHPWRPFLPAGLRLVPVQLPGRETRLADALPGTLAELAADVVDALCGEIAGPYALFGHSCGALLAYEAEREIRRRGLPPPRALLVSGGRAPGARPDRLLHRLDDRELRQFVTGQGGLPPGLLAHPDLVAQLLGVIRADLALTENHDPRPIGPVPVPLHAFGGHADATVSLTEVERWRLLAGGLFTLHSYPGGHFHLYANPGPLLADVAELVIPPT